MPLVDVIITNYQEVAVKRVKTTLEAAIREMREELGVEVELIDEIGIVHDFYNLIEQENYSYYYLFKVTTYTSQHLEEGKPVLSTGLIGWLLMRLSRLLKHMTGMV